MKKLLNSLTIELMKLKTKFLSILLLLAISIGCTTYYVSVMNIRKLSLQQALSYVQETEKRSKDLKKQNVQMLSLGLHFFTANETIKNIFLTQDRELLYKETFPLFEKAQLEYGVTHLNFIHPDGKVFLRLQDKNTFDDYPQRQSFLDASSSQKVSSNLELGKNSFALRIVSPYYQGDTLIGYIELAQEIRNFIETLKYETGDEFSIYGKKQFLNQDDFTLSMQKKNLSNSWDKLPEDVLLGTTNIQDIMSECVQENNIANLISKNSAYREIIYGDKTFLCAGFPLENSRGEHIATIITTHNITPIISTNREAFLIELTIIALAFIFFVLIFYVAFAHFIIRPIQKITIASIAVASGNLKHEVIHQSSDEIGKLASSFNIMVEKLRETELAKDNFISLVSHQLRTPLASIKWLIELLLDPKTGRLNAKQKKFLQTTYASSHRLTLLINDILNINRINTGKIRVNYSETNIPLLAENIITEMNHQYQEKSVTISTQFSPGLPMIKTDPTLLRQVISNILSNAIKYTPKNGTVIFSIQKTTRSIRIEIADNGIGIPKDEQKRIFERFFRASNVTNDHADGTGLGLFIAKLILGKIGGKIGFHSEPNQGTTVWFTLPAKKIKA